MKTPEITINDLAKLPKWAQTHIRRLQCELASVKAERQEALDSQTPSFFHTGDNNIDPLRYVQTEEIRIGAPGAEYIFGISLDQFRPDTIRIYSPREAIVVRPDCSNVVGIQVNQRV